MLTVDFIKSSFWFSVHANKLKLMFHGNCSFFAGFVSKSSENWALEIYLRRLRYISKGKT